MPTPSPPTNKNKCSPLPAPPSKTPTLLIPNSRWAPRSSPKKGAQFSGCNVENASYGLTICAERNAIFAAVAAEGPSMVIKAVAVATEQDGACAPCGACRQVIFEFGPDAVVFFRGKSGTEQMAITKLLPEGFRL